MNSRHPWSTESLENKPLKNGLSINLECLCNLRFVESTGTNLSCSVFLSDSWNWSGIAFPGEASVPAPLSQSAHVTRFFSFGRGPQEQALCSKFTAVTSTRWIFCENSGCGENVDGHLVLQAKG